MVSFKKIVLLLFITSCYGTEQFIAETPSRGNRSSLSQSRRDAIDALEKTAHSLATELEKLGTLMHTVIQTSHDIMEGDTKSSFVTKLKQSNKETIKHVQDATVATQKRVQELEAFTQFLK